MWWLLMILVVMAGQVLAEEPSVISPGHMEDFTLSALVVADRDTVLAMIKNAEDGGGMLAVRLYPDVQRDAQGMVKWSPCYQRMQEAMRAMDPALRSYNYNKKSRPQHDFQRYYKEFDATMQQWDATMRDCVRTP